MQESTFTGWDFTNIWGINEGLDYPDLRLNSRYAIGCTIDTDCDSCRKCVTSYCINQAPGEDLKNECTPDYHTCLNDYTRQGNDGTCNGLGNCDNSSRLGNVTIGNVCINGTDTNPTTSINCDIWSDCIYHSITANEYYIGYLGDGTSTCNDTDWQTTGTTWNTSLGYRINETGHFDTCPEEFYYILPGAPTTHTAGGGGNFPETAALKEVLPPTPAPTTLSLGGFLQSIGLKMLWQSIKNWFLTIGIRL